MPKHSQILSAFCDVFVREWHRILSRPIYFYALVFAPIFSLVFFTSLMNEGLPHDLPVGIVDMDKSSVSRQIGRTLDAFDQTRIVAHYPNFSEARKDVQKGKIYGFFYIPPSFSKDANAFRQPKVSFYVQYTYLITGSLLMKDMKTTSALIGASSGLSQLRAKGYTDAQAMFFLQPIVNDVHPTNNPSLNYGIYLNNTLVPGILLLIIFLMTTYAIGSEIKENTSQEWMKRSKDSILLALTAKLLPYTLIFSFIGIIVDTVFYLILGYPCHCGILPMLAATLFSIVAAQGFGILVFAIFPSLRMSMSIASLWGVLSISISGFTFPYLGFYPFVQSLSYLFPLRHYYLIYVTQALDDFSMVYAWKSYLFLFLFALAPFLLLKRLRKNLVHPIYLP